MFTMIWTLLCISHIFISESINGLYTLKTIPQTTYTLYYYILLYFYIISWWYVAIRQQIMRHWFPYTWSWITIGYCVKILKKHQLSPQIGRWGNIKVEGSNSCHIILKVMREQSDLYILDLKDLMTRDMGG